MCAMNEGSTSIVQKAYRAVAVISIIAAPQMVHACASIYMHAYIIELSYLIAGYIFRQKG